MGKKLSRTEFETLASTGAVDEVKQKEAMTEEKFKALAATSNSRDPEIEYHEHADSQYGKGYLQAENDYNMHLAKQQGKLDELGNAAGRVALNLVPGIIGSIGGIGDVPDWFAGVNDQTEEVGNALTRWSNEYKQKINEEVLPIYQQDQTPGVHLGSSEWWFDKGAGVVSSAAEFAALGFGMGSLITKGLSAAKWLTAIDAATGGVKLNALGQSVGVATNAFALNQAESVMDATQTYDDEYKKNIEAGLSEHEAKVNAAQAAAHVINIDRINIIANLTSVGAIMRGSRGTREIKSLMNPVQKTVLEGGQEYLEETVNYFATQRGTEKGEASRTGKEYTGPTVAKLMQDMASAQGIEAGFLGMLGGVAQTGLTETVQALKGTNKDEKEWIANQQNYGAKLDEAAKANKRATVFDTTERIDQLNNLIATKTALEEDINKTAQAGGEISNDKVVALQQIQNQILTQQAYHTFRLGTTDYTEKAYQDIASLTVEAAKENGFTGEQLNPKSPSYYKTRAEKALNTIKTLEKAYKKAEQYMNPHTLFQIKATENAITESLANANISLAAQAEEAMAAMNAISRKIIVAKGVSTMFTTEDINTAESELDLSRKHILTEAKKAPAVIAYNKLKKNVEKLEDALDATRESYAMQTSDEVQDQLKAMKKEELENEIAAKKNLDLLNTESEQIAEVKKAAETKVAKAAVAAVKAETIKSTVDNTFVDDQSIDNDQIGEVLAVLAGKVFNNNNDRSILTADELATIALRPAEFEKYLEWNVKNAANNKQAEQDKAERAGDTSNLRDSDMEAVQIDLDYMVSIDLGNQLLPPAVAAKKAESPGKLTQASNVLAWLARLYTKQASPTTMLPSFADKDNNLNADMLEPLILDSRFLNVNDKVTLEVDENGVAPVLENGVIVMRPWKEAEKTYANAMEVADNTPIVIKKDGKAVAHLHLPSWINSTNTQKDVGEDVRQLRSFRRAVLESRTPLESVITNRSLGKLFIDNNKTPSPVSVNLPDAELKFGVVYNGALTNARTTDSDLNKLNIANRDTTLSPKTKKAEGKAYALLPIKKINGKPEETIYWAVPMLANKLSEDMINSIVEATRIFYNAIDNKLTDEDNRIADQLLAPNRFFKKAGNPRSFDVRTPEGLRNYLNLFLYSHNKDTAQKNQTLTSYLKNTPGLTTDYLAHEVGNTGVFFGAGKLGVTIGPKDMNAYLTQWREHLAKRYIHTSLDYTGTNVAIPVVKVGGEIVDLNEGKTSYEDFQKAYGWSTNVIGHNISTDPAAPNYVYTIQHIIQVKDPTAAEVAIEEKVVPSEALVITPEAPVTPGVTVMKDGKPIVINIIDEDLSEDSVDYPLLDTIEAYKEIRDKYRITGISYKLQTSLINFFVGSVNEKFKNEALTAANFRERMQSMFSVIEQLVGTSEANTKFANAVLTQKKAITNLVEYSLRSNFDYNVKREDGDTFTGVAENEEETDSETEEDKALNVFGANSLTKNPTKSLTGNFKRFLGSVNNPESLNLIFNIADKFNPVELYDKLSSLLAEVEPVFETMQEVLESQKDDYSFIAPVLEALRTADEQTKAQFVVAMSKHYVNMKHLYVVKRFTREGSVEGYNAYVVNDNSSSKAAVTRANWLVNLTYNQELVIDTKDEQPLYFNKTKAEEIASEILSITYANVAEHADFDIDKWLSKIGITLSPKTVQVLKSKGLEETGKKGVSSFKELLINPNSPIVNLAKSLRAVGAAEGVVELENSDFTKERAWKRLAGFDSKYNKAVHSKVHKSGDQYVYSYTDKKYLTDRFNELKNNLELLNELASRSFSKHSWWLKQLLKTSTNLVTGEETFDRVNGKVILNPASSLMENLELSELSLQVLIEKNVVTRGRKSLEDLTPEEHERAKFLLFQNTGKGTLKGPRLAEMFLMTFSNKNTMFSLKTTVPTVGLKANGNIDTATIDLLYNNVVMPEIQRMLDYNDSHNIASYEQGSKLFYFFPKLNEIPELFNEDGRLRKNAIAEDEQGQATVAQIKKIIEETITKEVKFKLEQWRNYKLITGSGKNSTLSYFDQEYIYKHVKEKIGSKATNEEVANYAATEMAVAYMVHNTNLFQNITTDPATQWKSNVGYSKADQVEETFINIGKRLGGEISPGRDLAQNKGAVYRLAVIKDVNTASKVLKELQALNKDFGKNGKDYARMNIADAVEFTTVPETLRFLQESGKLSPVQVEMANNILEKYDAGEDFKENELDFIFQIQKPVMMGTRVDTNVETKMYVKSAAFTLIPQLLKGTDLAKVEKLMRDSNVDRLVFESAFKLGAPRNIKKIFDDEGNFIEGSTFSDGVSSPADSFIVDRKFLRLQQEVPNKKESIITRVSQASKLLFVNILEKTGFKLPGKEETLTAKELLKDYNKSWETLYKISRDELLSELKIDPNSIGSWEADPVALAKLVEKELINRGYSPHDLDALGIVTDATTGLARFKISPWALAKSGKLEVFLNAIVSSRIVHQDFNGFSYVLASEVGFNFKKKSIKTDIAELSEQERSAIVFTDKFEGSLKPALANNGYHQVIVPWKYKSKLDNYIIPGTNTLDTSKFDPELLKAFGMRIPNQGPNSSAAIEIVGFLPAFAGDQIIAPGDFVVQMGSDFDIDKLYVYLANHDRNAAKGVFKKLTVAHKDSSVEEQKAYLQNKILDIHMSVYLNPDKEIQETISKPLSPAELKETAIELKAIEEARKKLDGASSAVTKESDLSPISGSYQSSNYVNSTVAGTAVGAFAVQNVFNAQAQQVSNLKLIRYRPLTGKPVYSNIRFGTESFDGETDLANTYSIDKKVNKSDVISEYLSAAVDDEKEQLLRMLGVNETTISMVNLLLQAGFRSRTISLFIKQDIIQEYTKQYALNKGNSAQAIKAVMNLPQFAGVSETFQRRGKPLKSKLETLQEEEDADQQLNDFTEGLGRPDLESNVTGQNPTAKHFWNLYHAGTSVLVEQLSKGPKATNYKEIQFALLQKFVALQENEVLTLRSITALTNADTKGAGKGMFESLAREESLDALSKSKLENSVRLFGEMVPKSATLSLEDIASLREAGYVETNDNYFKPTTIPGFAMAYGVIPNNRIWGKHFNYNNANLKNIFRLISGNTVDSTGDFLKRADRNRRIFNAVKNYIYTSQTVVKTPVSTNAVREALLYDNEATKNLSVASKYHELKTLPAIKNNKFLNNLFVKKSGAANLLLFRNPHDTQWNNFEIASSVIDSLRAPVNLKEFNGVMYTTRNLIEDVFLAARLSATSALQNDMLQFIPVEYLIQAGIAKGINTFEFKDINPSIFAEQYFQHHPNLVPQIQGQLADAANPETIQTVLVYANTEEQQLVPGIEKAAPVKEVVGFHLRNLDKVNLNEDQASTFEYPPYVTIKGPGKSPFKLFKLADESTGKYERIPTLGGVDNHEYNANTVYQTSNQSKNNVPGQTGPVLVQKIEHVNKSLKALRSLGEEVENERDPSITNRTPAEKAQHDNLLATYGIIGDQKYKLTKADVNKLLTTIKTKSINPGYSAVADFLLARWGDLNINVHSDEVTYGETLIPGYGKATLIKGGQLVRVLLNFPKMMTSETLEEVVLHEMLHAVTMQAIRNPTNDRQRNAARRLKELYDAYVAADFNGFKDKSFEEYELANRDLPQYIADYVYPAKNFDEFIVGLLTRPNFQKALNEFSYDEKFTFWEKFLEIFDKLLKSFGIERESTAGKAINDIMQLTAVQKNVRQQEIFSEPLITSAPVVEALEYDPELYPEITQEEAEQQFEDSGAYTDTDTADEATNALLKALAGKVKPANTADFPMRPSTKSNMYANLIAEKKGHISQLYSRRREINLQLNNDKISSRERLRLQKKKEVVSAHLAKATNDLLSARAIVKLEDLVPIAKQELLEIDKQLITPETLDYKDIDIISKKLKLWVNYRDMLTAEERLNYSVVSIFADVERDAIHYTTILTELKKEKVLKLAENITGKKYSLTSFYAAIKDIGSIAGKTLDLSNADHALLQSVFEYMKEAESSSQEELVVITKELKDLIAKTTGKENLTGKNLSNLVEDNGTLVMAYSQEFLNSKYSSLERAKEAKKAGDSVAYNKNIKDFVKFIKENEIVFDIRKLTKIEGFEDSFEEDGKLKQQLISLIGESEYNRKLKRALKLYDKYKTEKEVFEDSLTEAPMSEDDKAATLINWETENSLFRYLDYRQDSTNNYANRGWKYVESTPKGVGADGKPTKWYNEKYKTLQQDADVIALHDYIVNLMSKLRKYLPEDTAKNFKLQDLPAFKKSMVENLHTKGMAAAMTHVWDGVKDDMTSKDITEVLYGNRDKRFLGVNIDSISNRIDRLLEQKLEDYQRKNSIAIDKIPAVIKKQLKTEATKEVTSEESADLVAILGMYTAAVVDYKHKSKIEDAVRLAEEVFVSEIKGYEVNALGKPLVRDVEGNQQLILLTAGAKNYQDMLSYTLDRWFRVPKTIQGTSTKKLYSSKELVRKANLTTELQDYTKRLEKAKLAEDKDAISIAENKLIKVQEELDKLGRAVTGTGLVDILLKYITIKGIGWNPFSGLTNMSFGAVANMIESSAGEFFNEAQMLKGYTLTLNSVGKFWSAGTLESQTATKIRTLMDNLKVLKVSSEEMFTQKSVLTGIAAAGHWAQIQNKTEYLNQAPVMIAMMHAHKLAKLDGTESNLWEAYGKTGEWDEASFGPQDKAMSLQERAKFSSLLGKAIRKIHGNYDPSAPIAVKGNIVGKMLVIFRTWMLEGVNQRYQGESVDEITGNKRKGRYRSYGGGSLGLAGLALGTLILPGVGTAIGLGLGLGAGNLVNDKKRFKENFQNLSQFDELFESTKYLIKKLSFGLMFKSTDLEQFTEVDAQNMRRNMTEISMLLFVTGLAMVLKGLKDDEDDEEIRNVLTYQLNVMHRIQQDIGFYADPISATQIIKDPIPAAGVITDAAKFIIAATRYVNDDDIIETGPYAKQSRLRRASEQLVPLLKQVKSTEDLALQER